MAVISDLLEDLEGESRNGNIEGITRKFYATGAASTDAQIILEAFIAEGVPRERDLFPGHSGLVCTGRRVRLLRNSNRNVEITCHYEPIGNDRTSFIFSGGAALSQESTQVDRFQNPLVVSHTYPSGDPDYANETKTQGVDLPVLTPQLTLTATGQMQVFWPDYTARTWLGAMNSTFWAGGQPYQWLCTRVDFQPLDVGFGRLRWWEFTFEFQQSFTTWIPQIWFVDDRTQRPPEGLVPNVGIKLVDWYSAMDYNLLFPIR